MTLFNPSFRLSSPVLATVVARRDATIEALITDGFEVYSKSEPDPRSQVIHNVHLRRQRDSAHATIQVVPVTHERDYLVQVLLAFPVNDDD